MRTTYGKQVMISDATILKLEELRVICLTKGIGLMPEVAQQALLARGVSLSSLVTAIIDTFMAEHGAQQSTVQPRHIKQA